MSAEPRGSWTPSEAPGGAGASATSALMARASLLAVSGFSCFHWKLTSPFSAAFFLTNASNRANLLRFRPVLRHAVGLLLDARLEDVVQCVSTSEELPSSCSSCSAGSVDAGTVGACLSEEEALDVKACLPTDVGAPVPVSPSSDTTDAVCAHFSMKSLCFFCSSAAANSDEAALSTSASDLQCFDIAARAEVH